MWDIKMKNKGLGTAEIKGTGRETIRIVRRAVLLGEARNNFIFNRNKMIADGSGVYPVLIGERRYSGDFAVNTGG